MSGNKFDVIVVGAGPGGYVAAIRAAQLGLNTAIIEKQHLGGICLNWGCIPTKALLRSADVYSLMKHAGDFGLKADGIGFDLDAIVKRSRGVAAKLSSGIGHLMKKNKIQVINGTAKLLGNGKVEVLGDNNSKADYSADNIIIATGARARILSGFEPDGKFIWTYKEALVPTELPKSLLVIGSGAIGVEFANFYHTLGSDVTVAEVMDRIMPAEDAEISDMAKKAFEKRGMKIKTSTKVKSLEKTGTSVIATLELPNGGLEKITVDRVIVAVGVVPNTDNIGLENTKVKTDRGIIITDEFLRTDEPNVYAIGDVTKGPWLAHKASHEGIIVAEKIANLHPHVMDRNKIPGCTYTTPQVASIGLTEAKAIEAGYSIKVGRFPFMANGKAIAMGESDGMIKVIFNDKTGELLGAHMIGAEVTEMVQGFGIAQSLEATEEDLMNVIFAHPTMSEAMHEAVLDAYKKALHI